MWCAFKITGGGVRYVSLYYDTWTVILCVACDVCLKMIQYFIAFFTNINRGSHMLIRYTEVFNQQSKLSELKSDIFKKLQ